MGRPSDVCRSRENSFEVEEALLPQPYASDGSTPPSHGKTGWLGFHRSMVLGLLVVIFGLTTTCWPLKCLTSSRSCDSIDHGYECMATISHQWGQYSPYFTVPSEISISVPKACHITFAQILSRHGARDPTSSKTLQYKDTITQLQQNVTSFKGRYGFLADYEYALGANDLTMFGQQQMINSGIKFFDRYRILTSLEAPFVRSSSGARVLESAMNFSQGFRAAKLKEISAIHNDGYPYDIVVVSEDSGSNNTLNHGLCTEFETGPDSAISSNAQAIWANVFIPPIQRRLNTGLPGANLSISQTIDMMDLCPFNAVANPDGTISPFCDLFSDIEWQKYSYYETLGKYYGYSYGNPLGPTQGVGFTNELIARMTFKPVQDETSTNRTLDDNPATFPIGPKNRLFADFSHDNDLTGIFSAMGLYNSTRTLSCTSFENISETRGYSAAWTVPFAARAYFEKMRCSGEAEELVRVIVNDRVIPLQSCGADQLGRCTLSAWVESLSFARANGFWSQCFVST